jgi:hypothetical protein
VVDTRIGFALELLERIAAGIVDVAGGVGQVVRRALTLPIGALHLRAIVDALFLGLAVEFEAVSIPV